MRVELKPRAAKSQDQANDPCADVACSAFPTCADGSNDCAVCACCACAEGTRVCDATYSSGAWACEGGCFVPAFCEIDERCDVTSAECVPGSVDCDRLTESDLIPICDYNEDVCAACGCYSCFELGEQICDPLVGTYVLSCTSDECYAATACAFGATCLTSWTTGLGQCSDEADCEELECVGPRLCEEGDVLCEPCACCDLGNAGFDYCGADPNEGGWAVYRYDVEAQCYLIEPCTSETACVYGEDDAPACE